MVVSCKVSVQYEAVALPPHCHEKGLLSGTQTRIPADSDFGTLTLLFQDETGGWRSRSQAPQRRTLVLVSRKQAVLEE